MSSVGGGPITQCECPQCNKRAIITIMTNHATPIPDQFVCLPGMKHSSTAAYCLSNPTGFTAAIGGRSKTTIEKHHKRCLGRREPSQVHHATSPRSPTRTTVSQLIQQPVRSDRGGGGERKPTAPINQQHYLRAVSGSVILWSTVDQHTSPHTLTPLSAPTQTNSVPTKQKKHIHKERRHKLIQTSNYNAGIWQCNDMARQ